MLGPDQPQMLTGPVNGPHLHPLLRVHTHPSTRPLDSAPSLPSLHDGYYTTWRSDRQLRVLDDPNYLPTPSPGRDPSYGRGHSDVFPHASDWPYRYMYVRQTDDFYLSLKIFVSRAQSTRRRLFIYTCYQIISLTRSVASDANAATRLRSKPWTLRTQIPCPCCSPYRAEKSTSGRLIMSNINR